MMFWRRRRIAAFFTAVVRVVELSRVATWGGYDGELDCAMPARMRAPSGLVRGHPTGRWTLDLESVRRTLGR